MGLWLSASYDGLVEDLTLLLIYLTAWEEKVQDGTVLRFWKGYRFEVLDALAAEGCLRSSVRSKSVYLTQSGVEKAEMLKRGIEAHFEI